MAKNKGGKRGKQERKAKADARKAHQEHGCQEAGGCKAIATVFLQTRTRIIRLCPEHARKRGYCQTCCKKRSPLEDGICVGCWAKITLGLNGTSTTPEPAQGAVAFP